MGLEARESGPVLLTGTPQLRIYLLGCKQRFIAGP
jgi:hypothetical protein